MEVPHLACRSDGMIRTAVLVNILSIFLLSPLQTGYYAEDQFHSMCVAYAAGRHHVPGSSEPLRQRKPVIWRFFRSRLSSCGRSTVDAECLLL